jgi:hypothetical protein
MATKCGLCLLCLATAWGLQPRTPLPRHPLPRLGVPVNRAIALKDESLPPGLELHATTPPPPCPTDPRHDPGHAVLRTPWSMGARQRVRRR